MSPEKLYNRFNISLHCNISKVSSNLALQEIVIDSITTTFLSGQQQCSRLKPSCEFHFEGLSTSRASVEGLVQINPRNIEMNYETHMKLVRE
jgi:hypothetical protein